MIRLDTRDAGFTAQFETLVNARREAEGDVARDVAAIIRSVRDQGEAAVKAFTQKLDRHDLDASGWRIEPTACAAAFDALEPELRGALELAANRIRAYHERQLPQDRDFTDAAGVRLGARWRAVDAAGLYVPGGRAAYPSSLLMNAIPAKVAGVARIAMATPTPNGEINPLVLAAAHLAGVDEIWRVGGAQAIAAFAYGAGRNRAGRRGDRPGQRLGRGGQAPALRRCRHRHGRRAERDRRRRRREELARVDRRRPALPGRARHDPPSRSCSSTTPISPMRWQRRSTARSPVLRPLRPRARPGMRTARSSGLSISKTPVP